jgi:hypothetical protein
MVHTLRLLSNPTPPQALATIPCPLQRQTRKLNAAVADAEMDVVMVPLA